MLVLADRVVLLQPLQMIHAIAPHIAHRNPRLFGIFCRKFGQFAPPLLVQFGNWNADELTVQLRI